MPRKWVKLQNAGAWTCMHVQVKKRWKRCAGWPLGTPRSKVDVIEGAATIVKTIGSWSARRLPPSLPRPSPRWTKLSWTRRCRRSDRALVLVWGNFELKLSESKE